MRPSRALLLAVALLPMPAAAVAQDGPLTIEPLSEGPPEALAGPVREALAAKGFRIVDAQGEPFLDLWLREGVPATGKPAGPQGAILFPILAEGELLGAARYHGDNGADYRDQIIAPGAYTLRYGKQPVNGDHLGVSTYRDFALLVPAAVDKEAAPLDAKALEKRSAEAAGTSHPAVLMLLKPSAEGPAEPRMEHDEANDLWGAVLGVPLKIEGESGATALPIQLIVVGAAAV